MHENPEKTKIIKEMNDEYTRRGGFERIFPTETHFMYKKYFEKERPYNTILFNYINNLKKQL